jgi:hypothetical protein
VIFGFHEKTLHVIVNKIALGDTTIVVLPGGYIGQKENLSDAVERIVNESTGLEKILFRQFAVFGDASRSFGKEFTSVMRSMSARDKEVMQWVSRRFVSVCYLALVDFSRIVLKPTQFLDAAEWLPIGKNKILSMDHAAIVKSARASLAKEIPYAPVESNLLPAKFTLPDLHALFEAILGREVDRPNFRRKILKSGLIVKVGQDASGKRRPADLYAFKHGKKTSVIDDLKFGF